MFQGKFVKGIFLKSFDKLISSQKIDMLIQSLDLYFKVNPFDGIVYARIIKEIDQFPIDKALFYIKNSIENFSELEKELREENIDLCNIYEIYFGLLSNDLSNHDNISEAEIACRYLIKYSKADKSLNWYHNLRTLYTLCEKFEEAQKIELEALSFVSKKMLEKDFVEYGLEWEEDSLNDKELSSLLCEGLYKQGNYSRCELYLLKMMVFEPEKDIYRKRLFEILTKNGVLERLCDIYESADFVIDLSWAEDFFQIYLQSGRYIKLFELIESDKFVGKRVYPVFYKSLKKFFEEYPFEDFIKAFVKYYTVNFPGMEKFLDMLTACPVNENFFPLIEGLSTLTELHQFNLEGLPFHEFLMENGFEAEVYAIKLARNALRCNHSDYALKGMQKLKELNNFSECWTFCEQFLETFHDNEKGVLFCVDIYFLSGKFDKDKKKLSSFKIENKPSSFIIGIGAELFKRGNYQEARFILEKLNNIEKYEEAILLLMNICLGENVLEKYYYYLRILVLNYTNYPERFQEYLGFIQENMKSSEIYGFYQECQQKGREDLQLSALLVEKYIQESKFFEAIPILKKINQKYDGKNIPILYNLGLCSLKSALLKEGKEYFDLLIENTQFEENQEPILIEVGRAFFEAGLYKPAINYLKPLVERPEPNPEAMKMVKESVFYIKQKNRENGEGKVSDKRIFQKRYEIQKMVGEGGMGTVYKAMDLKLQREIAIKILSKKCRDYEKALLRFKQEAKISASLNHQNVIRIYDVDYRDPAYITMEFVDGRSLRQMLSETALIPLIQAKNIIMQTLEGLAHIHQYGIIHRDIKPDNVMMDSSRLIKIMDLGLAVLRDSDYNRKEIMGTGWYMSPEQFSGENVTPASDIYSFGMMMFELLTGRVPFCKGNIAYRQINEHPPQLKSFNSLIPDSLEQIVLKCIEKKPEQRYQSAFEIKDKIKQISFI